MAGYYLAPSLAILRSEINSRWPDRDKSSDGWIGDAAHSARKSDHNPDWPRGVVRAIDIDKDGLSPAEVLAAAFRYAATNYVIFAGQIYSRSRGFRPIRYTGSNGHYKHIHISILHTLEAETAGQSWFGGAAQKDEDSMTQAQFDTIMGTLRGYGGRIERNQQILEHILPRVVASSARIMGVLPETPQGLTDLVWKGETTRLPHPVTGVVDDVNRSTQLARAASAVQDTLKAQEARR